MKKSIIKITSLIAILLLFSFDCEAKQVKITVFFTSDEHGWFEKSDSLGGISGLYWKWKNIDGLDSNSIILSGGDNSTGAPISSLNRGEAQTELMSKIGYNASALGNHEFDFGIENIEKLSHHASFPYLAANVYIKGSDKQPDYVKPYLIKNIDGIKVGIIGLANYDTPNIISMAYSKNLEFKEYLQSILKYSQILKKDGVKIIIVASHVCFDEWSQIEKAAKDLNISFIFGGHCHQKKIKNENNFGYIETGYGLSSYAKGTIFYDTDSDKIIEQNLELKPNFASSTQPDLDSIILKWKAKMSDDMNKIIGFASSKYSANSSEIKRFLCNSFLESCPDAKAAFVNYGSIRTDLPKGNIYFSTIMGMLPFENYLVKIKLSGANIIEAQKDTNIFFAGINKSGVKFQNGEPIINDSIYTVVMTDFLWGSPKFKFSRWNNNPQYTGLHWRESAINWIKKRKTDKNNPIDKYFAEP